MGLTQRLAIAKSLTIVIPHAPTESDSFQTWYAYSCDVMQGDMNCGLICSFTELVFVIQSCFQKCN